MTTNTITLYHGTSVDAAKSIASNGFDPACYPIYTSPDLPTAAMYAYLGLSGGARAFEKNPIIGNEQCTKRALVRMEIPIEIIECHGSVLPRGTIIGAGPYSRGTEVAISAMIDDYIVAVIALD